MTLSKGDDRQLDCCVLNDSYPPLDNVYWNYNNQYIASGTTLKLSDFDEDQTGVYQCSASNRYGTPAVKKFFVSLDAVGGRNTVPLTTVGSSSDVRTTVQTATTLDTQVSSPSKKSAAAAQSFHPVHLLYMLPLWFKKIGDG